MVVSKQLQKQIIFELVALVILVLSILYALFAIGNNEGTVLSQDGMVLVLDGENFKAIEILSDGEGLNIKPIKYTVTNNNDFDVSYKLVLKIDGDEQILDYIRVGSDDLYIEDLLDLEKLEEGYVVASGMLNPGFTRIHTIKLWYRLDATEVDVSNKLEYSLELVRE